MRLKREKLKVLLVDDDEDEYVLMKDMLEGTEFFDYEVTQLPNYEKATNELPKNNYDVYLIDFRLGSGLGTDLIKTSYDNGFRKPSILLTGQGSHAVDIAAMEAGAYDYINKEGLNPHILDRSIRYSIRQFSTTQAIEQERLRFINLFNNSTDGILIVDQYFKVRQLNKKASKIFGDIDTNNQYIYLSDLPFISEDFNELMLLLKNNKDINNFTINVTDINNRIRTLLLSSQYLSPSSFDEGGFMIVLNDITLRLQAERQSFQMEKLQTTEKMTRLLIHEIRNPLSTINMAVSQLAASQPDSEFYEEIVRKNTSHIDRLLKELLSYSSYKKPHLSTIDPVEPIEMAIANVKDKIRLSKVFIEALYSNDHLPIKGDTLQISIAITNILSNSLEALSENKVGDRRLTINTSQNPNQLIIEISDNGPGMTDDAKKLLFEPFYTGKKDGFGMGLANSYNIIETHGGTIEVESKPGFGAKFLIKLPTYIE